MTITYTTTTITTTITTTLYVISENEKKVMIIGSITLVSLIILCYVMHILYKKLKNLKISIDDNGSIKTQCQITVLGFGLCF